MRERLQGLLESAIDAMRAAGELVLAEAPAVPVERARAGHGDFATPVALALAREARAKPRDIAQGIVARLGEPAGVQKIEVAGPGFINFFLDDAALRAVVTTILGAGGAYGRSDAGAGERVQVEFVSANPTGPLHVGHGRGAAYGDALANVLDAAGFDVQREYYVNDVGRQMDILAVSVWLRYQELAGETMAFFENGYQGDYIYDVAASLHRERGDDLRHDAARAVAGLPPDATAGGDKERHTTALIERVRALLGETDYVAVRTLAHETLLADIRGDLEEFGVRFDRWYSEGEMRGRAAVEEAVAALRESGYAYDADGAVWLRTSDLGDEKDRVVIRDGGEPTYFASDIAYHKEKFDRGFDRVIDVWGADHHGYIPRVKAALAAFGRDPDRFEVQLVQLVNLYRGGKKMQMSTRSGEFETLRSLRREVGRDAARYFYVLRKCEQHLDFDLDLAKSQSNDNPVYYVQYAHARICSVMRQAAERGVEPPAAADETLLDALVEAHELDLARTLSRYPEVVEAAAAAAEPHQVCGYLRELSTDFHTYYNAHTFLVDDERLRDARLALIAAVRQVIASGLALLGVSAPETM